MSIEPCLCWPSCKYLRPNSLHTIHLYTQSRPDSQAQNVLALPILHRRLNLSQCARPRSFYHFPSPTSYPNVKFCRTSCLPPGFEIDRLCGPTTIRLVMSGLSAADVVVVVRLVIDADSLDHLIADLPDMDSFAAPFAAKVREEASHIRSLQ